ncbi:MAG: prepilin-type N-terminal cleavage/methylation domain-containing protein [Thermodesulfobacteriota bacterium]
MRKSPGFTLLEIVVVLLVLGIVSAVVITRYVSANIDARNAAMIGRIKAHLRYARNASMNSETAWWIDFNAGSYVLNKRAPDGTNIIAVFPGEDGTAVNFPGGFTGPDINVLFDGWGRPVDGTGTPTGVLNLAFTSDTVTIRSTGYIP